jgi:hypothetical protein
MSEFDERPCNGMENGYEGSQHMNGNWKNEKKEEERSLY